MNITRFQPGTILGALLLLGLSACSGHHQDDSDGSVTPPASAPTVTIAASPSTITQGGSTTLTWSTTDATACTASGGWSGSKATSGSESATPAASGSVTYTLTCTGTGGSAVNSTTVTVTAAPATPAPTVNISAAPTSVTLGSATTLTWSTANATACTASGNWTGSRGVSGSESSTPAATGSANYTLTCTGTGGSASGTATVTVSAASPAPVAPTVTLNANPSTVTVGASTTLTWSSTDATGCTASNAWTGNRGTRGTESATPAAAGTSNYTLTCTGPGGSGAATASVTVNPAAVTVLTIKGRVIDDPIASASVTIYVGGVPFTTSADDVGNYGIPIQLTGANYSDFVTIVATGPEANSPVSFESLPGTLGTLVTQAGSDGVLDSTENFRTNVTNISTAEAALVIEANDDKVPANDDELAKALMLTDGETTANIATAIRLITDDGVALPDGAADTLQFATTRSIRELFINDQTTNNYDQFESVRADVLNDPALTMSLTAATVPSSIYVDRIATVPADDLFSENEFYATRLGFNADGTGSYATSFYSSTALQWTIDAGGNVVSTFTSNPTHSSRQRNVTSSSGMIVDRNCTEELKRVTYRQIGPMSARVREESTLTCDDGDVRDLDSNYVAPALTPQQVATQGVISVADVTGKTLVMKLYDRGDFNGMATFDTPADFVTFNADGTGSTRFFGLTLQWSTAGNVLTVNFSNGLVAKYSLLRTIFNGGALWLGEFTTPNGYYVANSLVSTVDGSLFTNDNALGDYYQYGVGASSDDLYSAVAFSDTGASGDPAILKGFALRFDINGSSSILVETFEYDDNNNVTRSIFGGNRVWGARADGSLSQERYVRLFNVQGKCTPAFDTTDPNCGLTDLRDVFPVSSNGARRVVVERRRMTTANSGYVTDATPADFVVRFYDVAPVGDYEQPRSNPAKAAPVSSARSRGTSVKSQRSPKSVAAPKASTTKAEALSSARRSAHALQSIAH